MDTLIEHFYQYALVEKKISILLACSYKEDVYVFKKFLETRAQTLTTAQSEDIQAYFNWLCQQTVSYSYGLRRINALKAFYTYLSSMPLVQTLIQLTHELAPFIIFCTKNTLALCLQRSSNACGYYDVRAYFILRLLSTYDLSIAQLASASLVPDCVDTLKVTRTSGSTRIIELTLQDKILLTRYTACLYTHIPEASKCTYLFVSKYTTTIKPLAHNALATLVKNSIKAVLTPHTHLLPVYAENLHACTDIQDEYIKKHPRA